MRSKFAVFGHGVQLWAGRESGKVGRELLLRTEGGGELRVQLEDSEVGPGLGAVLVSVQDGEGREVVPEHPYHFDVRRPDTLDLARYVEEPEELPDLPAFLQVEPYQGLRLCLGERGVERG